MHGHVAPSFRLSPSGSLLLSYSKSADNTKNAKITIISIPPLLYCFTSVTSTSYSSFWQRARVTYFFIFVTYMIHFWRFYYYRVACMVTFQARLFRISSSTSISCSTSIGFATCAFIPHSSAFFLSSSKALAVMATMGIDARAGSSSARIAFVAS